jgi:hypothetical protein
MTNQPPKHPSKATLWVLGCVSVASLVATVVVPVSSSNLGAKIQYGVSLGVLSFILFTTFFFQLQRWSNRMEVLKLGGYLAMLLGAAIGAFFLLFMTCAAVTAL